MNSGYLRPGSGHSCSELIDEESISEYEMTKCTLRERIWLSAFDDDYCEEKIANYFTEQPQSIDSSSSLISPNSLIRIST